MSTHLIHINDVIAPGDTSVFRLVQHYHMLRPHFSEHPIHVHLIGSTFGDTQRTAAQLTTVIELLRNRSSSLQWPITLCVNNASRAKHTNSWEAKGSSCLRWTITADLPYPIHIVGVDDDVFGGIREMLDKISLVSGIIRNGVTVADISKWSQFRSLEFWPLVQYIVQFTPDPNTHLLTQALSPQDLPNTTITHNAAQKELLSQLTLTLSEHLDHPVVADGYTIYPQAEAAVYLQWDTHLHRAYQYIQLQGELQKAKALRHLPDDMHSPLCEITTIEEHTSPQELLPNQLLVIDKDKFGNTKTCSAHDTGIYGIAEYLGVPLWSQVTITYHKDGKPCQEIAYLVHTISDKTWEKCIRNGSSRWAHGKIFVELNRSIGDTYQKWDELDSLRIGDIVTITPYS